MNRLHSKFLSYVLRHDPAAANVKMHEGGWVSVSDLLKGMKEAGRPVSFEQLQNIVDSDSKSRYAFSKDKSMIRASQGHSVDVDLGYQPQKPPAELFHGTATRFMESILQKGLIPGSRHHVHLSSDTETAYKVGKRHGSPIVLRIDAKQMDEDGIKFYCSDNGVWLTDRVLPKYITT